MPKTKMSKERELAIGAKIRRRRLELGLTQTELAQKLGITYQQIQKYETARNRVSASRLADFAAALNVPVVSFYDETETARPAEPGERLTLELVRNFRQLDEKARAAVAELARRMVNA